MYIQIVILEPLLLKSSFKWKISQKKGGKPKNQVVKPKVVSQSPHDRIVVPNYSILIDLHSNEKAAIKVSNCQLSIQYLGTGRDKTLLRNGFLEEGFLSMVGDNKNPF